jgi:lipoprotein-anchoring transpeptidase ErfK/SrfK
MRAKVTLLLTCCLICFVCSACGSSGSTTVGWNANFAGNLPTIPVVSTPPPPPSVTTQGRLILVSLSQQWLWAFQDGQLVYNTPVTTGQPGLETPAGSYTVLSKVTEKWFYSPWPKSSPYYYEPELHHYVLYFRDGGFAIHDMTTRHQFGPGTNVPHVDADGTKETGSHGCVNVPLTAAAWIYQWASVDTPVHIVDNNTGSV